MCVTHRCTFGQNIPYDMPYPIFKGLQKDNPQYSWIIYYGLEY